MLLFVCTVLCVTHKKIMRRKVHFYNWGHTLFIAIQVGEVRPIQIKTISTGRPDAPCYVTVTNPKGQNINLLMSQTTEGYQTVLAPMEPGPHKLSVNFAGKEVPRSPFMVNVEPAVDFDSIYVKGLERRKCTSCVLSKQRLYFSLRMPLTLTQQKILAFLWMLPLNCGVLDWCFEMSKTCLIGQLINLWWPECGIWIWRESNITYIIIIMYILLQTKTSG